MHMVSAIQLTPKITMLVVRTSFYYEPDQTLFTWGAYTASDNAPAR